MARKSEIADLCDISDLNVSRELLAGLWRACHQEGSGKPWKSGIIL